MGTRDYSERRESQHTTPAQASSLDRGPERELVRHLVTSANFTATVPPPGSRGGTAGAIQAVLYLQRTVGNHAVGKLLSPNGFLTNEHHILGADGFHPSNSVIQRQPKKSDSKPFKINIRIASTQTIVENTGLSGPYRNLVDAISKKLQKRFADELQRRLSFLNTKESAVSVTFGRFRDAELKVAGNIQVWLVPELDQNFAPGEVMKKLYKYDNKAAEDVSVEFADDSIGGPGHEPHTTAGLTPGGTAGKADSRTSRPIFVKLRESFVSRSSMVTDISEYNRGKKEAAEAQVDAIATTTLHELGHMFGIKHTEGNFDPYSEKGLHFKRSFPPRLMDTVKADTRDEIIGKADQERLGGWRKFLKLLESPIIKQAHLEGENMHVWYDQSALEFEPEQKKSILEFLEKESAAK